MKQVIAAQLARFGYKRSPSGNVTYLDDVQMQELGRSNVNTRMPGPDVASCGVEVSGIVP